ncbi:MAG: hypothetical protein ACTSXP_06205, partial [Promethearchaeota archaeon]
TKQQRTQELIAETKKRISESLSSVPKQFTQRYLAMDKGHEQELIKEGAKLLQMYGSAEPVSEEQRQKDMADLLSAVAEFDRMEKETPVEDIDQRFRDIGYGLWIDTITREIRKIINDTNIKKYGILQIEKLISFLPRQFDLKDIRNALELLKNTKEVLDIIELNPKISVIAFRNEILKLTVAEKTLLSLIASEYKTSKKKIKDIFGWDDEFLSQNLAHLQSLNIIQVRGNEITAEGLMQVKDRERMKIQDHISKQGREIITPSKRVRTQAQGKSIPARMKTAIPSTISASIPQSLSQTSVNIKKAPAKFKALPQVPPLLKQKSQVTPMRDDKTSLKSSIKPGVTRSLPKIRQIPQPIIKEKLSVSRPPSVPSIPPVSPVKGRSSAPPAHRVPSVPPVSPVKGRSLAPPAPRFPSVPPVSSVKGRSSVPSAPRVPSVSPKPPSSGLKPSLDKQSARKTSKFQLNAMPVTEEQLHSDIEDLLGAISTLEAEAAYSQSKDDLRIYDWHGEKVNAEKLISKTKIEDDKGIIQQSKSIQKLSEKIFAIYEKHEIVNGGVMQLKKLEQLLIKEGLKSINKEDLKKTIDLLKSMGMISRVLEFPNGEKVLLFKDIPLSDKEIEILGKVLETPKQLFVKTKLATILNMTEEEILDLLKNLQEKGIIRYHGDSVIEVPGFIQH